MPLLTEHLIGHTLLSKKLGVLYMPIIGFPALFWALFYNAAKLCGKYIKFYSFYTELLADWIYEENKDLFSLPDKQK